jgi:membrane protease YdiL (CAAX protease family)
MRKLAILEPLLVFGLIVAYIWKLRFTHPRCWIAIPALMLLSHLLHREGPRALGFEPRTLRHGLNELAPLLTLVALLMLAVGTLLQTLRQTAFDAGVAGLAAYLLWGLTQQYALNGYFLNRFDAVFSSRAASSSVTALLFSAVHAPNPFLMAVTLPLGWCATLLYRRTRNLYLLGIAHGTIGLLLFVTVPDSVSHHLRVGPGWFRP